MDAGDKAVLAAARLDAVRPAWPVPDTGTPAELIAVVPWLLGFRPGNWDLVLAGMMAGQGRPGLVLRMDLPSPSAQDAMRAITKTAVAVLLANDCTQVTAIGFGPGDVITPALSRIGSLCDWAGPECRETLRADDGRYWRGTGDGPADGIPYGGEDDRVAAACLAAGALPPAQSKDALAATIAPATGAEAEAMGPAWDRALARATGMYRQKTGRTAAGKPVVASGIRAVAAAVRASRDGAGITSPDELAWLAFVLSELKVRDAAWMRMDPAHCLAHARLWTHLTRLAPGWSAAAPATLLAVAAWQAGSSALARLALERALDAQPRYSLARLLLQGLEAGRPGSSVNPESLMRGIPGRARRDLMLDCDATAGAADDD